MLSDRLVVCIICHRRFVFSAGEQLAILRAVPLDDLLDPPGKELARWILPPSECRECEWELAKRK